MKTTQNNNGSNRLPIAFRMPCMVALLLCGGVSARASLAALQNNLSALTAQQNQLSTGLQINSGSDVLNAANPYTWLQAAPNVSVLNYGGSQVLQQQVLQLLQDGTAQTGVAQLAQANQSVTALSTLQTANSQVAQLQVAQLQTANTTPAQAQQVLTLIGQGNTSPSGLTVQPIAANSESLSLVSQQLQTSATSLQQLSQVQSAVNLAQANQLNQLSTGLKINQAADPAQLYVSTQNGLVMQLSQNNDGYNNTLGLNTAGLSVNNQSLQALFSDAANLQNLQNPLTASDFTTVGQLSQSQALAFFQMAQSVNGNNLQSLATANAGGLGAGDTFSTSVIAMNNLNSPYLFVSIVDQSGLDAQDYNSAVLAINIGAANVHALLAAPEPSLYLTLGGFLTLAIWAKRRTDRVQTVTLK